MHFACLLLFELRLCSTELSSRSTTAGAVLCLSSGRHLSQGSVVAYSASELLAPSTLLLYNGHSCHMRDPPRGIQQQHDGHPRPRTWHDTSRCKPWFAFWVLSIATRHSTSPGAVVSRMAGRCHGLLAGWGLCLGSRV